MKKNPRVSCDCNGLSMSGTYEITSDWLILHSPLGDSRVRLGIANPHKLATKLLKNLCTKASAAMPADGPEPCAPSLADRAQERVDAQRDKVVTMATDDPDRAKEERILDQLVETSRAVEAGTAILTPAGAPDAQEEASPSAAPASAHPAA